MSELCRLQGGCELNSYVEKVVFYHCFFAFKGSLYSAWSATGGENGGIGNV